MHIVNSVRNKTFEYQGWVTFKGVWSNISDTFPCLVLFCGVRDMFWCSRSIRIVSVQLCAILTPNTLYFGDNSKWKEADFSPIRSKGPWLTSLPTLYPLQKCWMRAPVLQGKQNNSLRHSWIWILIMWQAGGELTVRWVVEWKRPACTDYIT